MDVWKRVRKKVEADSPAAEKWLNLLTPKEQPEGLILEAANRFVMNWVQQECLLDSITEAVRQVHPGWSVKVVLGKGRSIPDYDPGPSPEAQIPIPGVNDRWARTQYTFERFVVGKCNALAYEVAQGMVRGDDQISALFLLAGPGLGKTHLGTAVAHAVQARAPKSRVQCLGVQQFVSDMVRAIQAQQVEAFQRKYQKADLLVLEEVHFIGGKARTQQEVAGILDCLMDHRCRVVLTAALPPAEIPNLRGNLKSRFHQAILAEVQSPDPETRGKILRQRAGESGLVLPDEILELLVGGSAGRDIRSLEGILSQLRARSEILRGKITPMLAKEVLDLYGASQAPHITLQQIIETVGRLYDVKVEDLKTKSRQKPLTTARAVFCFLAREHTDATVEEVGHFVNRSHGTVIYNIERVSHRVKQDPKFHKQLEFLSERLEGKR